MTKFLYWLIQFLLPHKRAVYVVPQPGTRWQNKRNGVIYLVEGLSTHSETHEQLVIYGAYLAVDDTRRWARPAWMWDQKFVQVCT